MLSCISRLPRMLTTSSLDEIIVVLGSQAREIKPHILNHTKVKVVYNKDYNLGQTSSFKAGWRESNSEVKRIFLLPVDYPVVRQETVGALRKFFEQEDPLILFPTHQGRKGHPRKN